MNTEEILQITHRDHLEEFCCRRWSIERDGYLVSLEICPFILEEWDAAWIARLYTHRKIRGSGYAREAMQRLCDAADAERVKLILGINPYADMDYAALEKFYCSFGFVKNQELATILIDDALYVREPRDDKSQRRCASTGASEATLDSRTS